MATIREVAKEAGVSVATVSRVLNGGRSVAEDTAARVMAAIEKLDYSPNMLGNNLRKARTQHILVLLPSVSNQFFSKILRGIEEEAKRMQYYITVCMTQAESETEKRYLSLLRTRQADGVIFLSTTLPPEELTALSRCFPVVQCCEYIAGSRTAYVAVDDEQAGYDAVCALIGKGHRRIAFLGSNQPGLSSERRLAGYLRALREHQIPDEKAYVLQDTYSFNSGLRSLERLLELEPRPTAVFAVADSVALGLLRGLHEKGIRVPEEMAVIGFDDIAVASFFIPSLSTVSQPQSELGRQAFRLLYDKICDPNAADKTVVLPHRIILRETV